MGMTPNFPLVNNKPSPDPKERNQLMKERTGG
jgi:hypothetical protein